MKNGCLNVSQVTSFMASTSANTPVTMFSIVAHVQFVGGRLGGWGLSNIQESCGNLKRG